MSQTYFKQFNLALLTSDHNQPKICNLSPIMKRKCSPSKLSHEDMNVKSAWWLDKTVPKEMHASG